MIFNYNFLEILINHNPYNAERPPVSSRTLYLLAAIATVHTMVPPFNLVQSESKVYQSQILLCVKLGDKADSDSEKNKLVDIKLAKPNSVEADWSPNPYGFQS
ncbi:hypothetical protein ILYODFUR_032030 [Ilyodon furcidens]|uniref:Uncharacterized protein n=1 Tax=Ilyodon furcidens TaxID=33524 RepID=A0ABV0VIW4_9TELE